MSASPTVTQKITRFTADVAKFQSATHEIGASIPANADRNSDDVRNRVLPLYEAGTQLAIEGADLAKVVTKADLKLLPPEAKQAYRDAQAAAANTARTVAQETLVGLHRHVGSTASQVHPSSAASKQVWDAATKGQDLLNVRVYGTINKPDAAIVADKLENVPPRVTKIVDALGKRHVLYSGKPTDVWGYHHLRGKKYGDDRTFDQLPGFAWKNGFLADPSRELPGKQNLHSEKSLVLHEFGHIVDSALAAPKDPAVSLAPEWNAGPQVEAKARPALNPYYKDQPWEWFAEAFMRYNRTPQSHASLARWYPKTYAQIKPLIGKPNFK